MIEYDILYRNVRNIMTPKMILTHILLPVYLGAMLSEVRKHLVRR